MRHPLAHLVEVRAKVASPWDRRSGLPRGGVRPRTWWDEPSIRTWITALVVAVSYYIATLIGLSVRFQSSPISPIWPSNAILLVALVLVPASRWRACLLAVFGAHMLAELPVGVPLLTASGLYLSNTAEAVLGAYLVRRLIGGAPWLGSPRRVGLYLICAVVVAPIVTSFVDAAVVVGTRWGDNYWLTFRTRCVSNSLAELTIGPALLLGLTSAPGWLRHTRRWRRAEAALLAVGLLLVGVIAFGGEMRRQDADLALLSTLSPFLLWAAVRFGVGGTSAALLGMTVLSTWGAVLGRGPFSGFSPAENVISLQLFLIGMSAPMLFLAALLQEREETKATLQASETRFRTMADHAPVLIWLSGPDARCTYFNAIWLAFTGRTLEQERGMGWTEGVHPDDMARCIERYQNAFAARRPFTLEYRLRRHDGMYRWVVDDGVPLFAPNGRFDGYIGSVVDITDRKRMEQALQASEERYRDLVESQTEMICRYLPDTTLTFVNEAYCQWYGKPREQLIGLRFLDFLDEPAREHHFQYSAALMAHPQTSVDEHEVTLPDGSIGWVQWVDHPIRDTDGRIVELQAIGRDITERKRAEEALRESEARFRAAFESAATGMMMVDIDGHALRVNRPIIEMLGYSEEELRSRTFADFTHPDDVEVNLDLLRRALAGEIDSYHLEKRFIHKEGRVVWGMLSAGVVRDTEGRPLYIVGQVQDITDRKRTELALRESEERYRAVVNNFPQGAVLLYGQDLRHLFAGGQGLSRIGLSREALEGKTIGEAFPADLAEALTPRYQAALAGAHASFDLVYAGHIYQTQLLPVQYASTSAGMVVMQDVTEQRRAQALAELDRAKTAFIANVSHEFRTPLTLLLGPAADALADGEDSLPPRQRERIELIQRNGLRLLKLVNTLLDFSSIEAGHLKAAFEPTDVADYTAELASTFRSAIERAELRLVVSCQPLSSLRQPVYVDREMWEKIVLNLLSNALKFTFEGEIVVSLRPANSGESVELEVRDTGVGIPAAELPHLFERFYRVPGARGRTHEGTGIGLALVQELVRLHGGTVRVVSTVDVGSSFIVSLPTGTAHLPAEYIRSRARPAMTDSWASSAPGATPFVEEALGWLRNTLSARKPEDSTVAAARVPRDAPSPEMPPVPPDASDGGEIAPVDADARMRRDRGFRHGTGGHVGQARERERILIADDNADMRAYLTRLLSERWDVRAVADGSAALTAARSLPPDLVLSDVMMPGLDGVALLRAMRADPATRTTPVVLLSARAGEEAMVKGLEAGADDYLVKPFAARELLARVRTHLELARVREETATRAAQLDAIFEAMTDGVFVLDAEGRVTRINQAAELLLGQTSSDGAARPAEERAEWLDVRDAAGQPLASEQLLSMRLQRGERLAGADAMTLLLRRHDKRERIVSLTGGPLCDAAGQVIGAVGVVRDVTERERVARELREAIAAAEATKREEEQRRREAERREQIAESLRDVLTILNSSRQVANILDYISLQAGRLLGGDAVAIYTNDGRESGTSEDLALGSLTLQAAYGLSTPNHADSSLGTAHTNLRWAMSERRPIAVLGIAPAAQERAGAASPDDRDDRDGSGREAAAAAMADYVEMRTEPLPEPYRTLLAIPIVAQDEVYGGILLLYSEPHRFTADEVALAMAYGDQVALAIANARLQAHIERAATEMERNRIARELHDTVTQEIFSASLLAQAIPRIWEQRRAEAERSLHELYQLTRGALAALRALLLELRPAVLEQRTLADLLRQLGDAMTIRAGVPITLTVTDDVPLLPGEVKFALYRIAQETLANAAKHAAARHITVRLAGRRGGEAIQLEVKDDGQGFEPGAVPEGHLGIGMMRERARAVGATLRIHSRAGQGTRVVVEWRRERSREDGSINGSISGGKSGRTTGREEGNHGRARK